jgi:transcriptional regulator with XRE-family HTH domain
MQDQQFFTREMGARLRKIRLAAMLTQAEKADRMGLKGKWRDLEVRRLELGLIGNPSLKTVNLFLQACGAGWSDISDLLMRPPRVPAVAQRQEQIDQQDTKGPNGRQTYQISNRA